MNNSQRVRAEYSVVGADQGKHGRDCIRLGLILPFQTHNVLLGEQADEPLENTLAYFGVNYAILAAGLGIATLIHRRRHQAVASADEVPATAS